MQRIKVRRRKKEREAGAEITRPAAADSGTYGNRPSLPPSPPFNYSMGSLFGPLTVEIAADAAAIMFLLWAAMSGVMFVLVQNAQRKRRNKTDILEDAREHLKDMGYEKIDDVNFDIKKLEDLEAKDMNELRSTKVKLATTAGNQIKYNHPVYPSKKKKRTSNLISSQPKRIGVTSRGPTIFA